MAFLTRRLGALLFVSFFLTKEANLFKLPFVADDNENGDDVNLKIINGDYAETNQFPYQVYVQTLVGGGKAAACGGTILTEKFILTAAHCVYQNGGVADASKVSVFVGVNDIKQLTQDQVYQATNVQAHRDYVNESPFHNDVAIIELADPIQFKEGIETACLNYADKHYDYLIASGFGMTSRPRTGLFGNQKNNPQTSSKLKYGYFKEDQSQADDCKDIFICIISYDKNNGDAVCEGDSGGALSTPPDSDGKMQVIGVTSNVSRKPVGLTTIESCLGDAKYTRLSTYSDFVDDVVGAENYCSERA